MTVYQLKRTDSNNPDFKLLVTLLDQDLNKINGDIQSIYDQHNLINFIETVVITYLDGLPVGCGCFKKFDENTVEIKRMFVKEDQRCKGIASNILKELELWAKEIGYTRCVLETGKKHIEAIGLYQQRFDYTVTEKYQPYVDMDESVCMEKILN